jgi:hypothetical protein
MIGHAIDPADPTIVVERDLGNDVAANDAASQTHALQMAQAAADFTTIGTSLGPIYSSDYMPFEHYGYVCIGTFDGADSEPFYHTANDTFDKVQLSFCTEVIRMVLATVLLAAGKQVGAALVFDPDPITSSGNISLTTTSPGLDAQRRPVSLQGLDAADASGKYHLRGTFCRLVDTQAPTISPPTRTDGAFVFSRSETGFKDVMAYHHIDRFRRYLESMGFAAVAPSPIEIDAHGSASHYDPATSRITLAAGSGTAPDHAEDGGMILHQYARAIQATQNPGFTSTEGLGSGFGDLVPALFFDDRHASSGATRGMIAPWAGSGRRCDRPWTFDNPAIIGEAARGERWASTLFEIYRSLGGDSHRLAVRQFARDLVLKLHLDANEVVPASGATATQMAQQLEAADENLAGWRSLAGGLHRKVIVDAFQRRHLSGYAPKSVDVYIDDGRNGAYEWLENYWETRDIWVRLVPYTAAQLTTAGPADHQEPTVGSPAYLYVRVKNRGTAEAGSGPVTVRAYHCVPGMGLVWPESWSPMTTPFLGIANILPGDAHAQIVGPFEWTPTVAGHECVLVIAECDQDPAVTELLAPTDHVEHSVLVPFDNNIAQRNLAPVPAGQRSQRRFSIRNPFATPVEVELEITSTLPQGSRVRISPADPQPIRLGPREEHWVELHIEPPEGHDTDVSRPHQVQVTALVEGRPIGGMTFYLASSTSSPSLRAAAPDIERRGNGRTDLFHLPMNANASEVEGTVVARLSLRKK